MTLLESLRPGAGELKIAARKIAWNSGVDPDALEGIVSRVEKSARQTMFRRFLVDAANDEDDPDG